MKLTITREQLQEGLVAVAASVPAKTTLPILSNILLEATKDGIRLSGTDLDIAVSTTVAASVDQEGAITLPARKLVEIVRELPSAAIRLTASGEQRVTIECGRSKFRLLGLPREEFPAFPGVKFEGGWRAPAKDLQKLIAAWRAGNLRALEKEFLKERKKSPELYDALLGVRNRQWLPKIEALLKGDQDYLVVVGALHFVGRDGLLSLLRRDGHKAVAVPAAKPPR